MVALRDVPQPGGDLPSEVYHGLPRLVQVEQVFDRDQVWWVTVDELGVQRVARYRSRWVTDRIDGVSVMFELRACAVSDGFAAVIGDNECDENLSAP